MKRIISIILAVMLVIGLAACGGGGAPADTAPTEPADTSSEPADTSSDDDAPAPSSGESTEISYEMDGVNISVVLPSSDWIDDGKYGSAGSYSVIWYYKGDYSNSPRISLEIRADTSSFDKRINDGDNRMDIANRTIGGVDMKGVAYDLYGMEWIEYVGKVNADNFASIRISRVDIESGEGKAVLDSIKFN